MALSIEQQYLVDLLRSQISMRLTAASGSSYVLPAKLGDAELWEDVRLGLNMFNTTHPIITTYSSKDLYDASAAATTNGLDPLAPENETFASVFTTCVIFCGLFFSGQRMQWFEAGKHFSYSDNGITLTRDKQQKFQSAGAGILQYVSTMLPLVRKTLGYSRLHIRGAWSGSIGLSRSLTRGLRGTRLGLG